MVFIVALVMYYSCSLKLIRIVEKTGVGTQPHDTFAQHSRSTTYQTATVITCFIKKKQVHPTVQVEHLAMLNRAQEILDQGQAQVDQE